MDKLRFASLGSGSSGNSYYVGTLSKGVLVDAGVGVRTLKKRLADVGLTFEHVWALFITHDHIDHVKAVVSLAEKQHIPVYTTAEVHKGIARNRLLNGQISVPRFIEKGETVGVADFKVTAFGVSHDSSDSVGYTITYKGENFTIATDLGYVCENAAQHIRRAHHLVIESNYDTEMLHTGRYPHYLKARIASQTGHLSNEDAAQFVANIYTPQLRHIYLCHLSKENNTPERAYATMRSALTDMGVLVDTAVQLYALPRTDASPLFDLG